MNLMLRELLDLDAGIVLNAEQAMAGKSPLEVAETMASLRRDKQCQLGTCPPGVPHWHVRGDPQCAMMLSLLHNSVSKAGSAGNNCMGLLSCSTMAKHIAALKKSGVQIITFPVSMWYRYPHLPMPQVKQIQVWDHLYTAIVH